MIKKIILISFLSILCLDLDAMPKKRKHDVTEENTEESKEEKDQDKRLRKATATPSSSPASTTSGTDSTLTIPSASPSPSPRSPSSSPEEEIYVSGDVQDLPNSPEDLQKNPAYSETERYDGNELEEYKTLIHNYGIDKKLRKRATRDLHNEIENDLGEMYGKRDEARAVQKTSTAGDNVKEKDSDDESGDQSEASEDESDSNEDRVEIKAFTEKPERREEERVLVSEIQAPKTSDLKDGVRNHQNKCTQSVVTLDPLVQAATEAGKREAAPTLLSLAQARAKVPAQEEKKQNDEAITAEEANSILIALIEENNPEDVESILAYKSLKGENGSTIIKTALKQARELSDSYDNQVSKKNNGQIIEMLNAAYERIQRSAVEKSVKEKSGAGSDEITVAAPTTNLRAHPPIPMSRSFTAEKAPTSFSPNLVNKQLANHLDNKINALVKEFFAHSKSNFEKEYIHHYIHHTATLIIEATHEQISASHSENCISWALAIIKKQLKKLGVSGSADSQEKINERSCYERAEKNIQALRQRNEPAQTSASASSAYTNTNMQRTPSVPLAQPQNMSICTIQVPTNSGSQPFSFLAPQSLIDLTHNPTSNPCAILLIAKAANEDYKLRHHDTCIAAALAIIETQLTKPGAAGSADSQEKLYERSWYERAKRNIQALRQSNKPAQTSASAFASVSTVNPTTSRSMPVQSAFATTAQPSIPLTGAQPAHSETESKEEKKERHATVVVRDSQNLTPLHWAAYSGHTQTAQMLLEHHSDVNARDSNNRTPLHYAALNGHTQTAQMLLEHHADVNASDSNNLTPLHWAAIRGNTAMILLLLQHNANPNIRMKNGRSVLDLVDDILRRSQANNLSASAHRELQQIRTILSERMTSSRQSAAESKQTTANPSASASVSTVNPTMFSGLGQSAFAPITTASAQTSIRPMLANAASASASSAYTNTNMVTPSVPLAQPQSMPMFAPIVPAYTNTLMASMPSYLSASTMSAPTAMIPAPMPAHTWNPTTPCTSAMNTFVGQPRRLSLQEAAQAAIRDHDAAVSRNQAVSFGPSNNFGTNTYFLNPAYPSSSMPTGIIPPQNYVSAAATTKTAMPNTALTFTMTAMPSITNTPPAMPNAFIATPHALAPIATHLNRDPFGPARPLQITSASASTATTAPVVESISSASAAQQEPSLEAIRDLIKHYEHDKLKNLLRKYPSIIKNYPYLLWETFDLSTFHSTAVMKLLKHKFDPNYQDDEHTHGETGFECALRRSGSRKPHIKGLLKNGATINKRNKAGDFPIHILIEGPRSMMATRFDALYRDQDKATKKTILEQKNAAGETPLQLARRRRNEASVGPKRNSDLVSTLDHIIQVLQQDELRFDIQPQTNIASASASAPAAPTPFAFPSNNAQIFSTMTSMPTLITSATGAPLTSSTTDQPMATDAQTNPSAAASASASASAMETIAAVAETISSSPAAQQEQLLATIRDLMNNNQHEVLDTILTHDIIEKYPYLLRESYVLGHFYPLISKALLNHGANPNYKHAKYTNGETAFESAISKSGPREIHIAELLRYKAEINQPNMYGNFPIHIVIQGFKTHMIEKFNCLYSSQSDETKKIILRQKNKIGETPLQRARLRRNEVSFGPGLDSDLAINLDAIIQVLEQDEQRFGIQSSTNTTASASASASASAAPAPMEHSTELTTPLAAASIAAPIVPMPASLSSTVPASSSNDFYMPTVEELRASINENRAPAAINTDASASASTASAPMETIAPATQSASVAITPKEEFERALINPRAAELTITNLIIHHNAQLDQSNANGNFPIHTLLSGPTINMLLRFKALYENQDNDTKMRMLVQENTAGETPLKMARRLSRDLAHARLFKSIATILEQDEQRLIGRQPVATAASASASASASHTTDATSLQSRSPEQATQSASIASAAAAENQSRTFPITSMPTISLHAPLSLTNQVHNLVVTTAGQSPSSVRQEDRAKALELLQNVLGQRQSSISGETSSNIMPRLQTSASAKENNDAHLSVVMTAIENAIKPVFERHGKRYTIETYGILVERALKDASKCILSAQAFTPTNDALYNDLVAAIMLVLRPLKAAAESVALKQHDDDNNGASPAMAVSPIRLTTVLSLASALKMAQLKTSRHFASLVTATTI